MIVELWIGHDSEGSEHGVIELLSRYSAESTEKNHEKSESG
jgi:hypothetical protein